MTEKDVEKEQDAALGRYMRLRSALEAARKRVQDVGEEMSQLASQLRSVDSRKLHGLMFEERAWLNMEALRAMAADLIQVDEEMRRARDRAITLGVRLGNE